MRPANGVLQRAESAVDREREYLLEEMAAFEAFRERVRLATPASTDATGPSGTTEQLLEAYRELVMDTLDHEAVYGDTLAESLEQELSFSTADLLLSKDPLTQRRKRNLLVDVTTAIERREQFQAELEEERSVLKTFSKDLLEIEATIERLPPGSPRTQPFEMLLITWEVYDKLANRCEELLERRQRQLQDAERSERTFGEKHVRNEYLYGELDTRYPVLSRIAATIERIESKRNGEEPSDSADEALQC